MLSRSASKKARCCWRTWQKSEQLSRLWNWLLLCDVDAVPADCLQVFLLETLERQQRLPGLCLVESACNSKTNTDRKPGSISRVPQLLSRNGHLAIVTGTSGTEVRMRVRGPSAHWGVFASSIFENCSVTFPYLPVEVDVRFGRKFEDEGRSAT